VTSLSDVDVIVVGGGISGLASAWLLHQRGVQVVLLEAAARTGGTIATIRERGCLLESGPNSALETSPLIGSFFAELGIAEKRIDPNPAARDRYVLRQGRLHALPLTPFAFLATPLFSTRAKLRILREPFIGRGAPDSEEAVAGFVRRRLGMEFLDYAVNPFVGGVFAGNPEVLSLSAAFPRLRELEQQHGSVIRGYLFGARAHRRIQEKSKRTAPIFAFSGGMQTLPDAIAQQLPRVELRSEVMSVAADRGSYVVNASTPSGGREVRARAVVLAVPAYAAARIVMPFAPQAAAALAAIRYAPLAVVHSAYRRGVIAHRLDGFGMLVPECERRKILGTIFSSALFENRAPDGLALLTTFVGGERQPELAQLNGADLADMVHLEHAALLGASARPEFVRVRRWPQAIPQYTLGHAQRIARVEETERAFPGGFFCANYRGGVSIGDCIQSAHRAVGEIAAFLDSA
jgi:oxygen-dependent protoporphyrinogen oxidase